MSAADARTSGERLERDQGERVLDAVQGLHATGDEPPDVGLVIEIDLHQQVVLAGDRVDFRYLFDVLDRGVGDLVGAAALAFDHDEDRLHQSSLSLGSSSTFGTGRRMNSGTWSPMPTTGPSALAGIGRSALAARAAPVARDGAGRRAAGPRFA